MAQMSRSEDTNAMSDSCFDEAATWHARWQDADSHALSPEEVDRWAQWSAVPENKRAYDAVEFVSRAKYALEPPPLPTPEELAADDSDGVIFLPRADEPPAPRISIQRWRNVALFAIAAAAVAVAFSPVMRWLNLDRAEPVHVVSTSAGEIKQIVLRDGSRVTLGAKTELSVHYGRCLRTILLENGEALFNVAHDPRCPFIVIAGGGAITALGTEFSVRRTLDRVTVQVAEGLVDVQPRDALVSVPWPKDPDMPSVTWPDAKLTQGQEVTYAGADRRSAVASEDPHVATAWLDGRRVYRHEPLAYLVADIGRYFEEPIEVDREVGTLQFTGLVYESQVKKFLQDLEIIFPVKVSRTEGNRILIQPRDTADRGTEAGGEAPVTGTTTARPTPDTP
jgi:transmembrane sensor